MGYTPRKLIHWYARIKQREAGQAKLAFTIARLASHGSKEAINEFMATLDAV